MNINLFDTFYDLLNTYVFGGSIVPDSYADLVCILVSCCATLFMISLPFLLVWRFIRMWF